MGTIFTVTPRFSFIVHVHVRISWDSGCYNIKLSMSVFRTKTNILSGRFYEQSLLVGSFVR